MLALRGTFATEMERNLKKEKLKWREAEEERMKSKIETEMAIAKMDWIKVSVCSFLSLNVTLRCFNRSIAEFK